MNRDQFIDQALDRVRSGLKTGDSGLWSRIRSSRLTFFVLLCLVVLLQLRGLPEKLSSSILDAALIAQPRVAPSNVRLVTITDRDYEVLFNATSPLAPQKLSDLLEAISKGGAKVIAVDLDTSHPQFKTLEAPSHSRVIWAVDAEETKGRMRQGDALGGRSMPVASSVALAAVPNDRQGLVRGYRREFMNTDGAPIPSLPYATANAFAGKTVPLDELKPADNERLLDFRYSFLPTGGADASPLTAGAVLKAASGAGWPKGLLHDRVVVLGGTYKAARDRYATPVGLMDGAEIVAQATEAEIQDTGIPRANPWRAGCIQLLAGLVLIAIYHQFSLRLAVIASLILMPMLSIAASLIIFHRFAIWISIFPVLLAVLVSELYSRASFLLGIVKDLTSAKEQSSGTAPAEESAASHHAG